MKAYRLLLLCFLATVQAPLGYSAEQRPFEFSGRVSALRMDSAILGPGWQGPSGLVVDDLADTSSLTGPVKEVVDRLAKTALPKGVTACADFTYMPRGKPRIVTLRVLVFKRPGDALAWWKEKYESPEAKKLYREVRGQGDRALDSTQATGRIVLKGNCLFTCHQLHDGTEYQHVLESYLKKLAGFGKENE